LRDFEFRGFPFFESECSVDAQIIAKKPSISYEYMDESQRGSLEGMPPLIFLYLFENPMQGFRMDTVF